jgi:hypothetical protein
MGQLFKCQGWQNPTSSSPDYFNVCAPPLVFPPDTFPHFGIPENVFGSQTAASGVAYAGLYGAQLGNQETRDYIQIQLTEPLHFRVRYVVSFYVSLCEASRYAISALGAYLSEDAISSNDLLVLDAEPQVLPEPLESITDTVNWVLVTDTFKSMHGGERFITIGNFFSDAESDTTFVNPNAELGALHAYYYIDDVSVVALDSISNSIEEQETIGLSIYPNPTSQFVHVRSYLPIHSIRLFDLRGREVLVKSTVGSREHSLDVSGLPAGICFLEATDKEGRRATERIVKTDGP